MTISEVSRQPEKGRVVTRRQAIYAARTTVVIDKKRGRDTEPWVAALAAQNPSD